MALLAREAGAASSVVFSSVPAYGSFNNLQGQVYGVNPAIYRVAVFINTAQPNTGSYSSWWSEPGCVGNLSSLTTIQPDGTWTTDITNNSGDQNATQIAAYIVPASFSAPVRHK